MLDTHQPHSLTRLPPHWRTLLEGYFANSSDACCLLLPARETAPGHKAAPANSAWDGEHICWVNAAMTRLMGQSSDELVGQPAEAIFAHDPAAGQEIWRNLGHSNVIQHEVQIFLSDGDLIWVNCECHTLFSDDGQPLGHLCALKNSSRQQQKVDNRLYLADSLQEAQQIAQIGSWEMSLKDDELLWSDEIYRILEVDKNAFAGTQAAYSSFIPEEEIPLIRQRFWEAVEKRQPYEMTHRLRMRDGRIKYVHELAKIIYDNEGQAVRAIGTTQDIMLLRRREEESQLHQDMLQSVFNAVYATDLELNITSWNRAAEDMYGWRQADVIGKPFNAIMQPEYVNATPDDVREQLFNKGFWQGEARHKNKAGALLPVLASGRLLRNRYGEVIGAVGVSHDISDFVATKVALQENEGRLKRAETLARIGHCAFAPDLSEAVVSDGLKEIWGLHKEADPSVADLLARLHPEDHYAIAAMQQAAAEQRDFEIDFRLVMPDGAIRYLHSIYEYVPGSRTERPRYFGTMLDITSRKQAMALLENSQQQLNSQYQNLPVPTFTYQRRDGIFYLINCNKAAEIATNGVIKQHVGKALPEVVPDRADLIANIQTCFESRSTFTISSSYTYPSTGVEHQFRYTYAFAPPDLVMVFSEDITEEIRAKEAQRLSEERLEQAVRVADIGIFEHDHDSGKLYWSPELRRMYRVGADEDVTLDMAIAPIHEEDLSRAHANVRKAHDPAGDGLYDNEHRIVLPSGEVRWITIRSQTFFAGEGDQRRPVRTVGAKIDLTAHKQTAEELRIKEAAFEAAINGIAITNQQGEIMYVNPSLLRMWGFTTNKEVVGRSISSLWCLGEASDTARESLLREGNWVGDVEGLRPDGSRFDAQLSSSMIFDQNGQPQYQMCALLDLTRRRRDEKFLLTLNKAALAMQRALEPGEVFAAVADELASMGLYCGIFTMTEDGKHVTVQHLSHNQDAVAKALKLTATNLNRLTIPIDRIDAFRIPITEQKTILLNDIVEATRQFLPRPLRGLAPQIVKLLNVPKSINTPMIIAGEVVGLFSVQSNDLTSDDIPTITAFGNQMAAAWQQAKLYQQAQNELRAREQAENEVRRLNVELEERVIERTTQLEMANKELEAFSYSVSHDLRAPLRAIDGYTRFLLEDYQLLLDEEGQRICDIIRGETQRMGYLIDELLSFSRLSRTPLQTAAVDMAELAQTVMTELCASEDVTRITYVQGRLGYAQGDKALLRQVWQNLLSNAIKFSANVDTAVIEVSSESKGLETVYTIRDNGAGFDMEYADKLFGVFQRLHSEREFEGTGVGLAIVQRIINRHGGRVWAEGAVDEGATFYFSLPRKEKQA